MTRLRQVYMLSAARWTEYLMLVLHRHEGLAYRYARRSAHAARMALRLP